MNKILRFTSFVLINLFIVQSTFSAFSFKDMTSWVFGHKQETIQKEFPCTQDCTLTIENHNGSIHIKTWTLPKIVIQAIKTAKEKELDDIEIDIQETQHTITAKTILENKKIRSEVDYYVIVPTKTNLQVATHNGSIKIKNVQGVIEATVDSGVIDLQDVQNNIFLKNNYGPINVTMKEVQPTMHLILESTGHINLWLPSDTQADIFAKAPSGVITSELYLTLKPFITKLNYNAWSNFKKEIHAMLAHGGAQIKLISTQGNIKIFES